MQGKRINLNPNIRSNHEICGNMSKNDSVEI